MQAHREEDDFGQPGTFYREVLSETERDHLVSNMVGHANQGVEPDITVRVIEYWRQVDSGLRARAAKALGNGQPG